MYTVIKFVMMPYSVYLAQKSVLEKGSRNEIFPENAEKEGVRKAAISKPLDISQIRDVLKKNRISLNDYIIVSASLALSKICPGADNIDVSIPFTLKDYPKSFGELKTGNDIACLPFRL